MHATASKAKEITIAGPARSISFELKHFKLSKKNIPAFLAAVPVEKKRNRSVIIII